MRGRGLRGRGRGGRAGRGGRGGARGGAMMENDAPNEPEDSAAMNEKDKGEDKKDEPQPVGELKGKKPGQIPPGPMNDPAKRKKMKKAQQGQTFKDFLVGRRLICAAFSSEN